MKKKLNTDKVYAIANKMPYFVILILMILVAPLGVLLYVVRTKKNKRKIYNKSKNLTWAGFFIIFLIGVGIYSKIKEIIELSSSGMSLDMISFIPEDIWLYIIGIIMCASYLVGAKKIFNQTKIERNYIKYINIKKEASIKKISKNLSESIEEVKDNIEILNKLGYLIPLEVDDKNNKIIYKNNKEKKTITNLSNKNVKSNKTVQCSKCGAVISMKLEEYVECDFCGHGLIEENNL